MAPLLTISHLDNRLLATLSVVFGRLLLMRPRGQTHRILVPGGVMFGDDYGWPAVKADVHRFVDEHNAAYGEAALESSGGRAMYLGRERAATRIRLGVLGYEQRLCRA